VSAITCSEFRISQRNLIDFDAVKAKMYGTLVLILRDEF